MAILSFKNLWGWWDGGLLKKKVECKQAQAQTKGNGVSTIPKFPQQKGVYQKIVRPRTRLTQTVHLAGGAASQTKNLSI